MNPDQNQNGQYPPPANQQPTYGTGAGTPQQTYETLPPPSITGHSTGHNPYEFIVAPNAPKRKSALPGGNSFLGKILLFAGGFVVLLIVLGIILNAVLPKNNTGPSLTTVAQTQQEILRLVGSNQQPSRQATQNITSSIQISLTSDQQSLLGYMGSHGGAPKTATLALGHDAKTDELLTNAQANNTYDTVLLQTLASDLAKYQTGLQSTFKQAKSETLRTDVQRYYTAATLLSEQIKAAQTDQN